MTIKAIKIGKWYDTKAGIGECIDNNTITRFSPAVVKIAVRYPIPFGLRMVSPRDVHRQLEDDEVQAMKAELKKREG